MIIGKVNGMVSNVIIKTGTSAAGKDWTMINFNIENGDGVMPDIKSIRERREQSKRITKYRYFLDKLIKGK